MHAQTRPWLPKAPLAIVLVLEVLVAEGGPTPGNLVGLAGLADSLADPTCTLANGPSTIAPGGLAGDSHDRNGGSRDGRRHQERGIPN